jgi:hypothetical protein
VTHAVRHWLRSHWSRRHPFRPRDLSRLIESALVAGLLLIPASPALAQESKSAVLATQLATLLDQMKLDSVAGMYADQVVGALYIPGTQLLVVTGKSSAHFDPMLKQKAYRDVYVDLNGIPDATKVFISDLGANGLHFKKENNQPYDTVDVGGKTISFDGDWGKARISEAEYTKTWQTYDDRYSQLLQALITTLKK